MQDMEEEVPEVQKPRKLETVKVVEAALFLAGKWLNLEEIAKLSQVSAQKVEKALDIIVQDYKSRDSPIELNEEEGKFKFDLKPEYLDWVKNLAPQMDMRKAVLTTLSYVAHKQPITQSKMVRLFGNRIYEYTKELEQRGLISKIPHKRTRMLTTTKKLTRYLGASDLQKIKTTKVEAVKKQLKKEIVEDEKAEKLKKEDEFKQLEKKKDLSLEEWERMLEYRRIKDKKRLERSEKRKQARKHVHQ